MKTRVTGVLAAAALAVAALGGPVAADAEPNDHNCNGAVLSGFASDPNLPSLGSKTSEEASQPGPTDLSLQRIGYDCP